MTHSGQPSMQIPEELDALVALVRHRAPRAYLEIGAARGDTFHAIVSAMPPGSRAVAVDYPALPDSRTYLVAAVADLLRQGYDAHIVIGSSQAARVIAEVQALGPFDMAFLDGDHTPRCAAEDWINYNAPLTALPGIVGVPEFWRTLRAGHDHVDFIAPGSTAGIGVVYCGPTNGR